MGVPSMEDTKKEIKIRKNNMHNYEKYNQTKIK